MSEQEIAAAPRPEADTVERVAPRYGWVLGCAALLVLVLLLLPDPEPPVADVGAPSLQSPLAADKAFRPPTNAPLWGRFSEDCWVRLIVGKRIVHDRLYIAGERMNYRGEMPDLLLVGSLNAEIYLRGKKLNLQDGERRESVTRLRLRSEHQS